MRCEVEKTMNIVAALVTLFSSALFLSDSALGQGYPLTGTKDQSTTVLGEQIIYPTSGKAVLTSSIIVMKPGERTIAHRHGAPLFAYVLEGEITVDYGSFGKRTYKQGESLIEAMNVSHYGTNSGQDMLRLLVLYIGAEGTNNVVAE